MSWLSETTVIAGTLGQKFVKEAFVEVTMLITSPKLA
jgi:hypothetical protein